MIKIPEYLEKELDSLDHRILSRPKGSIVFGNNLRFDGEYGLMGYCFQMHFTPATRNALDSNGGIIFASEAEYVRPEDKARIKRDFYIAFLKAVFYFRDKADKKELSQTIEIVGHTNKQFGKFLVKNRIFSEATLLICKYSADYTSDCHISTNFNHFLSNVMVEKLVLNILMLDKKYPELRKSCLS